MVRLSDCSNMFRAVYCGRKATEKQCTYISSQAVENIIRSNLIRIYTVCQQSYKILPTLVFASDSIEKGIKLYSTNKQTTKFTSAKFQKNDLSSLYHVENSKTRANSADLDEVARDEPPHQDLHCLQIELFSSLTLNGPI